MPEFAVRPVDPLADTPLLHSWVTAERAAFWGMQEHTVDEVTAVYGYIDEQPHLRAFLVESAGRPLALVHTYDPEVDEIGRFYDRRPGDVGVHAFFADDAARAGRTPEIVDYLMTVVFGSARVQRVVFEPDTRNGKSLAMLAQLGAEAGPQVRVVLPYQEKDAQFYFFTRDRWAELRPAAGPVAADADVVLPAAR